MLASPDHEMAYGDLCELVGKHADKMSAVEILAIAANVVGKLMALQDQRTMTREKVIDVVMKNIELGNRQVVEGLATAEPAGHG